MQRIAVCGLFADGFAPFGDYTVCRPAEPVELAP
jgi:hypothetical protein